MKVEWKVAGDSKLYQGEVAVEVEKETMKDMVGQRFVRGATEAEAVAEVPCTKKTTIEQT